MFSNIHALIDKTDPLLQHFKTKDFLLEHDTRLPVTRMPKDKAPNIRVEIVRSLGSSLGNIPIDKIIFVLIRLLF